jgi:hypothetical protein
VPPKCCMDDSKYMPTVSAQNNAINVVRTPWETCQTFQKIAQQPSPRNLCQNNSRMDHTKSIQYGLYFLPLFLCPFSYGCTEFKNLYSTSFLLDCTFLDLCAYSSYCTTFSIRTVWPAFNVVLVASISVLIVALECMP